VWHGRVPPAKTENPFFLFAGNAVFFPDTFICFSYNLSHPSLFPCLGCFFFCFFNGDHQVFGSLLPSFIFLKGGTPPTVSGRGRGFFKPPPPLENPPELTQNTKKTPPVWRRLCRAPRRSCPPPRGDLFWGARVWSFSFGSPLFPVGL